MHPHFLRLRDLRDPDFMRSKLSYKGRRSRRLYTILTFPLWEDSASRDQESASSNNPYSALQVVRFFFFLLQTSSIHMAEDLEADSSRNQLMMWPPERETSKTPGVVLVNYKLALAKGICPLPLPETEPSAAAAVTFDTPWRELSVESGTCCSRKTGGTGL